MIATTDILDAVRGLYHFLVKAGDALGMTPFTVLVIGVVILGMLSAWAQRYNARRDMETAMRRAAQPPPPPRRPATPPPVPVTVTDEDGWVRYPNGNFGLILNGWRWANVKRSNNPDVEWFAEHHPFMGHYIHTNDLSEAFRFAGCRWPEFLPNPEWLGLPKPKGKAWMADKLSIQPPPIPKHTNQ